MKKTNATIDLTQGNPLGQILRFSAPLLLGNILQQLYNTVDSMVVGNLIGSNALAAVGASGPIIFLLLAFFMGLSAGAGILISQAFGARDHERLGRLAHTILTLTLLVSVALSIAGVALTPWLLRVLSTPQEVFAQSQTYMTITFVGIISVMLFNLINSILQGTGDSRSPFIILLICCGINIVLDLLFVAVFHWDVAGVAWATVIAQIVSVVFGLWRINRGGHVQLRLRALRLEREIIGSILRLGIPAGMQNALQSVGHLIVQGMLNQFGAVVMAANVAVIKVDNFCTMPIMTFGTAITVYVGQNVGAGRKERITKGVRDTLLVSVGISLLISALLYFFGAYPLGLFTQEADVIQAGMDKFHIVAPFYTCMAVFYTLSGMVRGRGHTLAPMIIGIATTFLGRVPSAYFLSRQMGANGVHWSLVVQWALEAAIIAAYCLIRARHGRRNETEIGENTL